MRYVDVRHITAMVSDMCIEANCKLPPDIKKAIKAAYSAEDWPTAKEILEKLLQNAEIAARERMPLCQDTGMTCVFVDVGQEVCFTGGYLGDAINEGVRQGYEKGCLRKSIVGDPLEKRENTGDNTPALIYYNIVPGDKLRITVAPKGFGSENMSRTAMLTPAHGISGVKDFVINTVKEGGPNPCPPVVVGVGIGGTFDKAAYLAKTALLRPVDIRNKDPFYARLEHELLEGINSLGIGPGGFGGKTTALAVNIEVFPTHIAGLPVAVNLSCHATRRVTAEV